MLIRRYLVSIMLAAGIARGASAQKPAFRIAAARTGPSQTVDLVVNRVKIGVSSWGMIGPSSICDCIDGGFWPRGTNNQYLWSAGFQVAGVVAGAKSGSNPWGGDTTGGFFWDPKGTTEHGVGLFNPFDATDPTDVANWPSEARVPTEGAGAEFFDTRLRGRIGASGGDLWYLNWEGDPGVNSGRPHPLGIVSEVRTLAWNYPVANDDIIYFLVTFYNITSSRPEDYAAHRPGLRERLQNAGIKFQQLNNTKFGVALPASGYSINSFHAAFAADPDVGSAGSNFSSVALPFAMGFTWDSRFTAPSGWRFDPSIFSAPFFSAPGFFGTPFLKSVSGPRRIALYSNTTNGGAFADPANVNRLYRYLSGSVSPDLGVACNNGDPAASHICYVAPAIPNDSRYFQSSGPTTLLPGGSVSMVVAFVFAAPVRLASVVSGGNNILPGDPSRMSSASLLASGGANQIDSVAGFAGYTDANGDGAVQSSEVRTVPRSLYAKAQLAQAIFDAKFLLPSAPEAPEFFLIPGDNKVTVVWKPSATETTGDPYYEIAKNAVVTPPGGGQPVANPLYDPNFRKFDVLGYRVFRGRTADPATMSLVAEYSYPNATFDDFDGRVQTGNACAPELGVTTTCAGIFDPIVPGVARVKKRTSPINAQLIQAREGDRILLEGGALAILKADTAGRGLSPAATFEGAGVPFSFVDTEVRNTSSYYYAVTAVDYNSIQSAPSSLESPRQPKRIVPLVSAVNYANSVVTESGVYGRRGLLTDNVAPTIDPVTGRFSKRALPANGLTLTVIGLVKELLSGSGEVGITLDSIVLGTQVESSTQAVTHHYSVSTPGGNSRIAIPVVTSLMSEIRTAEGVFVALSADPALAGRFGGGSGYGMNGQYHLAIPPGYYTTLKSRGCINGAAGFSTPTCYYNGPRWFVGDNETKDNPNSANPGTSNTNTVTTDFNNVGAPPPGVSVIHEPKSYNDRFGSDWRMVEGALSPFAGAADYRLYWGSNWVIDSVIDLTHDAPVPFSVRAGATWGVLNGAAVPASQSFDQRAALTASDIGCVEPLKSVTAVQNRIPCSGPAVALSNAAVPGSMVLDHAYAGNSVDQTAPIAARPGYVLYLKGHFFQVMLEDLAPPAKGTQWTMRDYVGAISGGSGAGGASAPPTYLYTTQNMPRPLTAVGVSVKVKYQLVNEVQGTTAEMLSRVHTVPDPYYIDRDVVDVPIRFVHLPEKATVRIYSSSGKLLRVLKQESALFDGELDWDLRTRENKYVASGIYFYHVMAENGVTRVGRLTIVHQLK